MKDFFLSGILLILFSISSGCSKSNNGNNSDNSRQEVSNWEISGAAFQGSTTYWQNTKLVSKDSSGNYLYIQFLQTPDSNATYNLQNHIPLTNTDCFIFIGSPITSFTSAGLSGDRVNVSVTGTKVVAAFTNITLSFTQGLNIVQTKASGTIIQQ